MEDAPRPPRIAIIGTGLAGLTTAHLLATLHPQDNHGNELALDLELFERSNQLGMDSSSLSVKTGKGSFRVDVPMRSINGGSHARVQKLYDYLHIPLVKSDFSYSFSRLSRGPRGRRRSADLVSSKALDVWSANYESRSSTPPPRYRTRPSSASASTTSSPSRSSTPLSKLPPASSPSSSISQSSQFTTLLYEGSSGLCFPPLGLPSSFQRDPSSSLASVFSTAWHQSTYIVHLILLALSYLHVLLLSVLYVRLGLTRSRPSFTFAIPFCLSRTLPNVALETLEAFCARHKISKSMEQEVLIPLMAAVCTVGVGQAREMPVGEALEYISATFLSSHYTTSPSCGVRGIVRRLIAPVPLSRIHLGAHIHRLSITEQGCYMVHYTLGDEKDERTKEVDYVVFATQANQAAALLSTLSSSSPSSLSARDGDRNPKLDDLLASLRSFTYVQTLVVTHTDDSILPPDQRDRRELNLAVFEQPSEDANEVEKKDVDGGSDPTSGDWTDYLPSSSVQTTHIVSSPHARFAARSSFSAAAPGEAPTPRPLVLQTTNPIVPLPSRHVLSSTWFSRASVTAASKQVLPRFLLGEPGGGREPAGADLQGLQFAARSRERRRGGIFFCGSWCARGIPLLEGCVTSAEEVVKALLAREGATVAPRDWPF
ncbi:SPOSA6832_01910, partial [Sporobolomyces salmonicolor]